MHSISKIMHTFRDLLCLAFVWYHSTSTQYPLGNVALISKVLISSTPLGPMS